MHAAPADPLARIYQVPRDIIRKTLTQTMAYSHELNTPLKTMILILFMVIIHDIPYHIITYS
jgi:hypothetical protein